MAVLAFAAFVFFFRFWPSCNEKSSILKYFFIEIELELLRVGSIFPSDLEKSFAEFSSIKVFIYFAHLM